MKDDKREDDSLALSMEQSRFLAVLDLGTSINAARDTEASFLEKGLSNFLTHYASRQTLPDHKSCWDKKALVSKLKRSWGL